MEDGVVDLGEYRMFLDDAEKFAIRHSHPELARLVASARSALERDCMLLNQSIRRESDSTEFSCKSFPMQ